MNNFCVALLQLTPEGHNQEANRLKGIRFCRLAKEKNADVALFPEMWNIGYTFSPMNHASVEEILSSPGHRLRREWAAKAIGSRSSFIGKFQQVARDLEMAILITYLQEGLGSPKNAAALIDSRGDVILDYTKVHTCEFDYEGACAAGEKFPTVALETLAGPIQIGVMICFDREFPEAARILMLNGAEIILTPNACEIEGHRKAQYATRAFENMVGVAMSNYAAPFCNGHSLAYSPIAFDREGTSLDTLIVEANEREGIWLAEFDMPAMREYRARESWGAAHRRPALYKRLTQTDG